jgi:hypothetical protein
MGWKRIDMSVYMSYPRHVFGPHELSVDFNQAPRAQQTRRIEVHNLAVGVARLAPLSAVEETFRPQPKIEARSCFGESPERQPLG